MIRLNFPVFSSGEAIEFCCRGITGNRQLLERVNNGRVDLEASAECYKHLAHEGKLHTIPFTSSQNERDTVVAGELTKSDLIKLYDTYFVDQEKPGRRIYDTLMAAANEKCPFCGGIGRPRNLDHFLPKARYPQFSIVPFNLVPSCRDCNMDGKGTSFATREEEQVLQPYLDNERYFDEQWIFCRYISGTDDEPASVEYFVEPPVHWEDAHKLRVKKHFDDFDLALRFSTEASSRLLVYQAQIQALMQLPVGLEVAKDLVLRPVLRSAPFINHWERAMCLALLNDM